MTTPTNPAEELHRLRAIAGALEREVGDLLGEVLTGGASADTTQALERLRLVIAAMRGRLAMRTGGQT